jgi:hypothetical protein
MKEEIEVTKGAKDNTMTKRKRTEGKKNNIIITFYLYLFYNKKNKHKNISALKQCFVEL